MPSSLTISGIEPLKDQLQRFADELEDFEEKVKEAVRKAIRTTTQAVYEQAVKLAPESSGRLKESARWQMNTDTEGLVEFTAPYALAQEHGSGIHYWGKKYSITPNEKEALKFRMGGEIVFADEVMHPGVEAQPYLRPALRKNKRTIKRELSKNLAQAFKEAF